MGYRDSSAPASSRRQFRSAISGTPEVHAEMKNLESFVAVGFSPASSSEPAQHNESTPQKKPTFASWLLIAAIHAYRLTLAPFLGGNCKFYPSCSHYAEQAIKIHGPKRGMLLAAKRLLRCRPFTKGGHDPVPDPEEFQSATNGQEQHR
jgi:putative membrane protein insertion efficiency factor